MTEQLEVTISLEEARECGYRKPSAGGWGIYLMGSGPAAPCERLPFPLTVCPCCGEGIKASRAPTWITPSALLGSTVAKECNSPVCFACPISHLDKIPGQHLLIWIGEKFYPTPQIFWLEAKRQGISRKIPAIPHGFEIGKTWVFLAHRKAITFTNEDGEEDHIAGIFMAFKPTHIDMVIDDPEDVPDYPAKLQQELGAEKVRIVKVIQDD